jgi:hypothetical protein
MVFPENKLHINNNYGCIVIIITNETISTEACDTKKIMKRKRVKNHVAISDSNESLVYHQSNGPKEWRVYSRRGKRVKGG